MVLIGERKKSVVMSAILARRNTRTKPITEANSSRLAMKAYLSVAAGKGT